MAKIRCLFVCSAALTVATALAFVNNVVAVIRWWHAFAEAGRSTAKMVAVGGLFPWLDWTVVDYSAVTTFIPFLGFLAMTLSLKRVLAGKPVRAENFPFYAGSDQLNVALGLFGTLWGIIVIGYFKLDTVDMGDLMQCLHTALFSTLMAVVWVFMIDRPFLRPLCLRALAACGRAESEEGDLDAAVGRLVTQLNNATTAFEERERAFEAAFEERAAKYAKHFEERLADYEKAFEARRKEYEEFFTRRIGELERRAEQSETRVKAMADLAESWKR